MEITANNLVILLFSAALLHHLHRKNKTLYIVIAPFLFLQPIITFTALCLIVIYHFSPDREIRLGNMGKEEQKEQPQQDQQQSSSRLVISPKKSENQVDIKKKSNDGAAGVRKRSNDEIAEVTKRIVQLVKEDSSNLESMKMVVDYAINNPSGITMILAVLSNAFPPKEKVTMKKDYLGRQVKLLFANGAVVLKEFRNKYHSATITICGEKDDEVRTIAITAVEPQHVHDELQELMEGNDLGQGVSIMNSSFSDTGVGESMDCQSEKIGIPGKARSCSTESCARSTDQSEVTTSSKKSNKVKYGRTTGKIRGVPEAILVKYKLNGFNSNELKKEKVLVQSINNEIHVRAPNQSVLDGIMKKIEDEIRSIECVVHPTTEQPTHYQQTDRSPDYQVITPIMYSSTPTMLHPPPVAFTPMPSDFYA